ncbi:MAG: UDP-N-acetylglucosamine 2-epimerase (non-hydrolyzing) [Clostridia bacterium]|nr:UDP-N-acetylglucosamine 2-epimerase (non-hydrolyzing) [Clostridia bacterium]
MVINTIIAILLACATSAIVAPLMIKFAFKVGAVDVPKDERKIHSKPMPRIGGLSFIFGFFVAIIFSLLTVEFDTSVNLFGFFVGAGIVAAVGFLDDIYHIKPWQKLLGQVVAAILVIISGLRICYINIPFFSTIYGLNDALSVIITFFWIIGVTNALNLIDGLDGLATGVSAIATLALTIVFILNGSGELPIIITAALLGGLIGFLPYNFNPAKTFMGDTGSNFLGFTLATVSMIGMAKTYTLMAIIIPVVILGLPIFDTLFAICRRVLHHKSIMEADRGHVHHKLIDAGLSQKQAVLVLYGVTALLGILAVIILESNVWKVIVLIAILAILSVIGTRSANDILVHLDNGKKRSVVATEKRNDEKKDKIKVMLVFGTRPEAIKMCPLALKLREYSNIETIVCVTAQHRQMLDQVLDAFKIKPEYDLNVMKDKQTLTHITAEVLERLCEVIQKEKPDIVLVHGDTTTTFSAALAAFYNKVKVGHVEAGLRTYDKYSPYPEEMNRQLVTKIADLYFAPTKNNKNNLLRELVDESLIYTTGNTVIDALKTTVKEDYKFTHPVLSKIDFNKKVIFMTAHRRENLGEPLQNICNAVKEIAKKNKDVVVVYPVHLNPAVQDVATKTLGEVKNVHLIEPLDVITTHNLMNKSYMVLTDSGGIQEEAPSLGKPVLVLRTETERPEAVTAGTVKIVGTDKNVIIEETQKLLSDKEEYKKMSKAMNPYGDGNSCERIAEGIMYYFGMKEDRPKDM